MSLSAKGLAELFVFVKSLIIVSTKSTILLSKSSSPAFFKKLLLNFEYSFFANCIERIKLFSLSHNKSNVIAPTPLCFKNLEALG